VAQGRRPRWGSRDRAGSSARADPAASRRSPGAPSCTVARASSRCCWPDHRVARRPVVRAPSPAHPGLSPRRAVSLPRRLGGRPARAQRGRVSGRASAKLSMARGCRSRGLLASRAMVAGRPRPNGRRCPRAPHPRACYCNCQIGAIQWHQGLVLLAPVESTKGVPETSGEARLAWTRFAHPAGPGISSGRRDSALGQKLNRRDHFEGDFA
jgi:hypothetical protein